MELKPLKPIHLAGLSSRIRLSPQIISRLGWADFVDGLDCYALLRKPGEILCSPSNLITESGRHPFQVALDIIDALRPSDVPELGEIPPSQMLIAPHRLSKFEARWASPEKKQLDLKLGKELIQHLQQGSKQRVFPICWGKILCLMSEGVYTEALGTDFTGGELHIQ